MSFFSRGKRPESAGKKPQPDNKKKQEEAAAQHALLQLQHTYGNKAVIQMIMQSKNDTAGVKPDSIGLDMLNDFPLTSHPVILNGWSIVTQQVYAYCRILSGYKNYVDKILAGNALALFFQYRGAFAKGIYSLLRNMIIPNVDTLIMILRQVASGEPEEGEETVETADTDKDDGNNQKEDNELRIRVLEELKRELEKRMQGEDLEQINKRVPNIHPSNVKSPAMAAFQKEIMSGAIFSMGEDAYFLSFLKKNDIDIEVFKQVIKTEDEKERDESETEEEAEDRLKKWQDEHQRLKTAS